MRIATNSSKTDISKENKTASLAKIFSKILNKGDVVFLYGEIGAGKTTFVRYLVNFLQLRSKKKLSEVTSPTFNIMNEYQVENLSINHFDLFRIEKTKDLQNTGLFNDYKSKLTLVEWPEKIISKPRDRYEIFFEFNKNTNKRFVKIKKIIFDLEVKEKLGENEYVPIKGDASYRTFLRKSKGKKNSIIVYCKKEKKKNLLNYDAINKNLIKNNIIAPKLYYHNYKNNYIEIEDLGNKTVFDIFLKKKSDKNFKTYKKIILTLLKIQNIKTKKIKNFMGGYYTIPLYTKTKIFNEAKLFCDWYVPANKKNKDIKKINLYLKKIIKSLIKKITLKNDTFVHRDFHISNIIPYKNSFGILDSQDAVIGNKAYDLASLIDDVRFRTNGKLKAKILNYYIEVNKNKINKIKFENDFYILSVLRNLKIIGIFTRLSLRDQKNQYLKLIPYAWKLIENRIKNNLVFKDLEFFLNKNFSAQLRKKYEN